MNSSVTPFSPIIDDVESTRRFVSSSLASATPASRNLPLVTREAYLFLPRLTREWQQHCGAYHHAREASSFHCLHFSSSPHRATKESEADSTVGTELSAERLHAAMEEERMGKHFSACAHAWSIQLLKANATTMNAQTNVSHEGIGSTHKRTDREEEGEEVQCIHPPWKEEKAVCDTLPTPSKHSASSLLCFSPHMQKEWWESSLSLSFLPQHEAYSLSGLLSSSCTALSSMNEEKEKGEVISTPSSYPHLHPRISQLSSQQRREGIEWYLYQRFFPTLYPPHRATCHRHIMTKAASDASIPTSWFTSSSQPAILWEDRRRGIDDFTLSLSPVPISCPLKDENGVLEDNSRHPMDKDLSGKTRKRSVSTCHVLFSDDVPRMGPFAFRHRVSRLWDLAEAISSVTSTNNNSMHSSEREKDTVDRTIQKAVEESTCSSFQKCVSALPLSPSTRAVGILLSYVSASDASSTCTVSREAKYYARMQVAGMLRCRVLVELCVLRLCGCKIVSRCPYHWRTVAHFLFSVAEAAPLLGPSFSLSEKSRGREGKEERDIEQEQGQFFTGSSLVLSSMAAYVHRVLIPYLSFKDKHLWYRFGKEEAVEMVRRSVGENGRSHSCSTSEIPSGPIPALSSSFTSSASHCPILQKGDSCHMPLSTSPAKHLAFQFPCGFLNHSFYSLLPSSLQPLLSGLLASAHQKMATIEKNDNEEEKQQSKKDEEGETIQVIDGKDLPMTEEEVQKGEMASFLVDLLLLRCGWAGNETTHMKDILESERKTGETEEDKMRSVAQQYLQYGIPFASQDETSLISAFLEGQESNSVMDVSKRDSREVFFLLRDIFPLKEKKISDRAIERNGAGGASTSFTLSVNRCSLVEANEVFHSSFARKAALKKFFIRYFLSDPQTAFDRSNQS